MFVFIYAKSWYLLGIHTSKKNRTNVHCCGSLFTVGHDRQWTWLWAPEKCTSYLSLLCFAAFCTPLLELANREPIHGKWAVTWYGDMPRYRFNQRKYKFELQYFSVLYWIRWLLRLQDVLLAYVFDLFIVVFIHGTKHKVISSRSCYHHFHHNALVTIIRMLLTQHSLTLRNKWVLLRPLALIKLSHRRLIAVGNPRHINLRCQ